MHPAQCLLALEQVRLQHHTLDGAVAVGHLVHHIAQHQRLQRVVFARIAVAAVHHNIARQAGRLERTGCLGHRHRVVVGHGATAQNQVAERVAAGMCDRHLAGAVDAQKGVRLRC